MPNGTQPIIILKAIVGIVSEVVGLFSIYAAVKRYRAITIVVLSVTAPILGGAIWLYLCKVNDWPFYLGGSHNEPYGIFAAIWGVVTLLPVIFSVKLVTSEYEINNIASVGCWFISAECLLVVLYVFLAGICALLFYGIENEYGVRAFISSFGMSYENKELTIIALWGFVISIFPTLALVLLRGTYSPNLSWPQALTYVLPALLAVVACLLALSGYFAIYDYTNLDQKAQIRGLIAGFVLRFSIFWGLWLAIDTRNFHSLYSILKYRVMQPFTTKKAQQGHSDGF
jgi:hypothetical protein